MGSEIREMSQLIRTRSTEGVSGDLYIIYMDTLCPASLLQVDGCWHSRLWSKFSLKYGNSGYV
jgi:hypothetical protein